VVIVDENKLARIAGPTEMQAKNAGLLNRVRDFISTDIALAGGVVEARERVSVLIAPKDGSTARLIFTGCVPGVSQEERAGLSENAVDKFISGGFAQQLDDGADRYNRLSTLALANAARLSTGSGEVASAPAVGNSVLKSVAGISSSNRSTNFVTRYVLVTDLAKTTLPTETTDAAVAREAGFEAAKTLGLNFYGSDVLVVMTPGSNDIVRGFFDALLLGAGGRLAYWGDGRPTQALLAPVRIERFVGSVNLPSPDTPNRFDEQPINVRLAWDSNGDLTQSFVMIRGRVERIVPITGRATCDADTCTITGDDGGFAQAWSTAPGGEPEFGEALPFQGARDIKLTIKI
jgi:hypothetical protein